MAKRFVRSQDLEEEDILHHLKTITYHVVGKVQYSRGHTVVA